MPVFTSKLEDFGEDNGIVKVSKKKVSKILMFIQVDPKP